MVYQLGMCFILLLKLVPCLYNSSANKESNKERCEQIIKFFLIVVLRVA